MSLINSGINLQQLQVFKDMLEIASNAEKKAKLLGEISDAAASLEAKRLSSQEAELAARKALQEAAEQSRKVVAQTEASVKAKLEAEHAQSVAAEQSATAKAASMSVARREAEFEAKVKDHADLIRNREISLAAAEKSLLEGREALAQAQAEFDAKAAKLKRALGE